MPTNEDLIANAEAEHAPWKERQALQKIEVDRLMLVYRTTGNRCDLHRHTEATIELRSINTEVRRTGDILSHLNFTATGTT